MVDPSSRISPPYHYRGRVWRGSVSLMFIFFLGAGKVVVFYVKSQEVCCSDNMSAPTAATMPPCSEYVAIHVAYGIGCRYIFDCYRGLT